MSTKGAFNREKREKRDRKGGKGGVERRARERGKDSNEKIVFLLLCPLKRIISLIVEVFPFLFFSVSVFPKVLEAHLFHSNTVFPSSDLRI